MRERYVTLLSPTRSKSKKKKKKDVKEQDLLIEESRALSPGTDELNELLFDMGNVVPSKPDDGISELEALIVD